MDSHGGFIKTYNNLVIEGTPYQEDAETSSLSIYQNVSTFSVKRLALNSGTRTFKIQHKTTSGTMSTNNSRIIVIEDPTPSANFTWDQSVGTRPLTVTFADTSIGSPTSWSWSFGDGNSTSCQTPSCQNPVWTYNVSGKYWVNLTVSNSFGTDYTNKSYIIVNNQLTEYGNVTQFVVNSGTTLTNYQIGLRLSNLSGISTSSVFGGSNGGIGVLYTNGTTKPDWSDIRFTDDSDNPLSYWVETGTQNATSAFVWVLLPSISSAGTTKVRFYYGCPTASSASDGVSTFNGYFSDFDSLANWTQVERFVDGIEWDSDDTHWKLECLSAI